MHSLTKSPTSTPATPALLALVGLVLLGLAVTRVHVRVQTTLVGYELGHLKTEEARLLEQRSGLKMQLAKLTSKKHLTLMSASGGEGKPVLGTVASR